MNNIGIRSLSTISNQYQTIQTPGREKKSALGNLTNDYNKLWSNLDSSKSLGTAGMIDQMSRTSTRRKLFNSKIYKNPKVRETLNGQLVCHIEKLPKINAKGAA